MWVFWVGFPFRASSNYHHSPFLMNVVTIHYWTNETYYTHCLCSLWTQMWRFNGMSLEFYILRGLMLWAHVSYDHIVGLQCHKIHFVIRFIECYIFYANCFLFNCVDSVTPHNETFFMPNFLHHRSFENAKIEKIGFTIVNNSLTF